MKRGTANLLILLLVLLVAVALINLTRNLQGLQVQDSEGVGTPFLFQIPTLGVDPLILSWATTLAGLTIFLGAFLYLRPRGRKFGFEEFIPLILGAIFLLAVLFLVQDVVQREGVGEEAEGEAGAGEEPPAEEGPAFLQFLRQGLLAAPGVLLLVGSFAAFVAIYFLMATLQARRARAIGLSILEEEELKREMVEALEGRIYRLKLGDDIRSVILGAYRDMVRLFRSYGLQTLRSQTAREVEAIALERLGLSGEASRALRKRFEEARYSLHPLTEEKRQSAIESLRLVKSELGD